MTITFQNVGFEWPDGKKIFENLNLSLDQEMYGLVGPNGIGKTTFAALVAQKILPTSGHIQFRDKNIFLFSQYEKAESLSVAEYLLESAIYEDARLLSFLNDIPFEKQCHELSGGQWTRVRFSKVLSGRSDFIILDEPTNHLDIEGRRLIGEMISLYRGGMLIISHDRSLLNRVDKIIELSSHGISLFSGGWDEYYVWREKEREQLHKNLESAKKNRAAEKRNHSEKIESQVKRQNRGQKNAEKGGIPKILLGKRKRDAQETMGKIDQSSAKKMDEAVKEAHVAYQNLKVDSVMFPYLPQVHLPQGKIIFEARDFNFKYSREDSPLWKENLNFIIQGSGRVAITGSNGSGKTTLLNLFNERPLAGEKIGLLKKGNVNLGFLDQHYSGLNHNQSIIENVREMSSLSDIEIRNFLAMFLFKSESVYQKVSTLSGGEKLRVSLAKILLATPHIDGLVLDEPTNNLDLVNIEFLERFLKEFQGALIVVSHDHTFLEGIALEKSIPLS